MSYTTIAAPITLSGPSLQSHKTSTVTIAPAEKGTGITLARTDILSSPVRVSTKIMVSTRDVRTTSLLISPPTDRPLMVHTVEHFLSALYGMGITDVHMTVDGEYMPILDGSCQPIVAAMQEVGIATDGLKPKVLTVDEPIIIQDESDPLVSIEIRPRTAIGCRFRYDFFTQRPVAGADGTFRTLDQSCIWEGDAFTYARELSPARTFSFKIEVDAFTKAGQFTHFTPKDLLVIDDVTGHPIQNMYRYKNELARHKLLDLVGDLALVGCRLQVDISARRSGHALNHLAAKALAAKAATSS